MAAGAADVSLGGPPVVGVAIKKGVGMKLIATSSTGYMGWYLLVKADSPVTKVQDLAGKKVGITSAGSGSDFLALWTNEQYKTPFTRVPLGGGGLVPNLRGGNVDAVVLYSPLSFEMVQAKQARMLIDYSAEVPHESGRRLGRHPEAYRRETGGGAEDAQRSVWRPELAAQQPRCGGCADRRGRRDQATDRRDGIYADDA